MHTPSSCIGFIDIFQFYLKSSQYTVKYCEVRRYQSMPTCFGVLFQLSFNSFVENSNWNWDSFVVEKWLLGGKKKRRFQVCRRRFQEDITTSSFWFDLCENSMKYSQVFCSRQLYLYDYSRVSVSLLSINVCCCHSRTEIFPKNLFFFPFKNFSGGEIANLKKTMKSI